MPCTREAWYVNESSVRQGGQTLMWHSTLWSTWLQTTWLGTAITPPSTTLYTMFSMTQVITTRTAPSPIIKIQPMRWNVGLATSIFRFLIWQRRIALLWTNGKRGSRILLPSMALTAFGLTLVLNKTNRFSHPLNRPPGYTLFVKPMTTR